MPEQLPMRSVIVTDLGDLPLPDSVEQAASRVGCVMLKGGLLERYVNRQMERAVAWHAYGHPASVFMLEKWSEFLAEAVRPKAVA
jgi:hypothetical protein